MHALYDAADDDSTTGGPDISRRIFPRVALITEDGFERLSEPEAEELSRETVDRRHRRPDGPNAAPWTSGSDPGPVSAVPPPPGAT